ncbi:MAG: hypothetical protein ACRDFB_01715 [Rhabdochlamydiaceae bacterium]
MFIGREAELQKLREFKKRKAAGIIVICGRRRIGKSTLVEHFAKGVRFLEFYGLAPREASTSRDQLDHFGQLLGLAFQLPPNLSFGFVFLVAIGDFERISLFLAEMHSQRSYA